MNTFKLITQPESWAEEVKGDVVGSLQRLLKRAEAGEIQGFVFVAETVDEGFITCSTKNCHQTGLIGAMERIKYRMLASED